jgi:hypothetical protein
MDCYRGERLSCEVLEWLACLFRVRSNVVKTSTEEQGSYSDCVRTDISYCCEIRVHMLPESVVRVKGSTFQNSIPLPHIAKGSTLQYFFTSH